MSISKTSLQNFIEELYKTDLTLPSKEEFEEFAEGYLEAVPSKKSSRRTTNPGDAFVSDLCKCRVWNKGFGKQCSAAPKLGEMCVNHSKKASEFGGWAFGFYNEDKPSTYLFDYNDKKTGMTLNWKEASKAPSKKLTPEIIELKKQFKETLGKDPKGPKASDPEWLRQKIDDFDPDEPEKKSSGKKIPKEIQVLKDEYHKVVGKMAKGPKANDQEWLKAKINNAKIESESSSESEDQVEKEQELDEDTETEEEDEEKVVEEEEEKDVEEEEEKEEEEEVLLITAQKQQEQLSKIQPLELDNSPEGEKVIFERITYWKRKVSKQHIVFNEDDHEVGRWSKSKNAIIFHEEDDWHKIHEEKVRELNQWNKEEQ